MEWYFTLLITFVVVLVAIAGVFMTVKLTSNNEEPSAEVKEIEDTRNLFERPPAAVTSTNDRKFTSRQSWELKTYTPFYNVGKPVVHTSLSLASGHAVVLSGTQGAGLQASLLTRQPNHEGVGTFGYTATLEPQEIASDFLVTCTNATDRRAKHNLVVVLSSKENTTKASLTVSAQTNDPLRAFDKIVDAQEIEPTLRGNETLCMATLDDRPRILLSHHGRVYTYEISVAVRELKLCHPILDPPLLFVRDMAASMDMLFVAGGNRRAATEVWSFRWLGHRFVNGKQLFALRDHDSSGSLLGLGCGHDAVVVLSHDTLWLIHPEKGLQDRQSLTAQARGVHVSRELVLVTYRDKFCTFIIAKGKLVPRHGGPQALREHMVDSQAGPPVAVDESDEGGYVMITEPSGHSHWYLARPT